MENQQAHEPEARELEKRMQLMRATLGSTVREELLWTLTRYFAPLKAIYEQFEKTAGMPTAWQRRKLDEDNSLQDRK
jgi:hypothetical protein